MRREKFELLLNSGLGVLACAIASPLWFVPAPANAANVFQTIDSTTPGVTTGTFSIFDTNLFLAAQLSVSGSSTYNYAAIFFNPTLTQSYSFGQIAAPVDTIMIIYSGIFDPASPGTNALTLDDDTSQSVHQTTLGDATVNTSCGGRINFCPQVTASLTAGTPITLVVSTFSSGSPLDITTGLSFYSNGAGTFAASSAAISPPPPPPPPLDVPTTASTGSLQPGSYLDGGTLRLDQSTTASLGISPLGGTIDTSDGTFIFSGNLSDQGAGNGGLRVTGGNSVTLSGTNSFTGGTTVTGGTTLVVPGAGFNTYRIGAGAMLSF